MITNNYQNSIAQQCIDTIKSNQDSTDNIDYYWLCLFKIIDPLLYALAYRYRRYTTYNDLVSWTVILVDHFDNWEGDIFQLFRSRLRNKLLSIRAKEFLLPDYLEPTVEDVHECESLKNHPDLTEKEVLLLNILTEFEDLNKSELAKLIGITPDAMWQRIARLRKKLNNLAE